MESVFLSLSQDFTESLATESVIDCQSLPSGSDCLQLLNYIDEMFERENAAAATSVLNKCGVVLLKLKQHNGFRPVSDDSNGEEDEYGERIGNHVLSREEAAVADLMRVVSNKIARLILSRDLRPIDQDADAAPCVNSVYSFEIYCRLLGCDAACAGLRDQRANWLHSEIGGTLASMSDVGGGDNSLEALIRLIDKVSLQCDVDMTTVSQIAGKSRWRQFAELYQTAAVDLAKRIKQHAASVLQSSGTITINDLSQWLMVCLKVEQLHARESFLHQAGNFVSVRPKSGSLLKSARPYSDGYESDTLRTAANNDSHLANLYSDAIVSTATTDLKPGEQDEPIAVDAVLSTVCLADAEKWPRAISKTCWRLWDVFGTFVQLFYVDSRRQMTPALEAALEKTTAVLQSFIKSSCSDFSNIVSTDFARSESTAYLILSDLTYMERQLNSVKAIWPSNPSTNTALRLISDVRELIRGSIDSMHARVIALNARLLLESFLHDWRPLRLMDEGTDGPPAALVAWALHSSLWHQRIVGVLSPFSVTHIYLSVALASFERVVARLINTNSMKTKRGRQEAKTALWIAVNLLFVGVKTPELLGSNFTSTLSIIGQSSFDCPAEVRDLVASYNALGNTLFCAIARENGAGPSKSRTDWILYALKLPLDNDDQLLKFLCLTSTCHPSNHLLTVRFFLGSPSILRVVIETFANDDECLMLTLRCVRAASSTSVEPYLLSQAITWAAFNKSSVICDMLTEEIVRNNQQCLRLIFAKCQALHDALKLLGNITHTLPCGCLIAEPAQDGLDLSLATFISLLPGVFDCLDLSMKMAVDAFTSISDGGVGLLLGSVLRCYLKSLEKQNGGDFFEKVKDISNHLIGDTELSFSGRRRHRRHQHSSHTYDSRLKACQGLIKQIITPNDQAVDVEADESYLEKRPVNLIKFFSAPSTDSAVITEAAGLELLAAVCSYPRGLEILADFEALLLANFENLNFHLLKSHSGADLLDIARLTANGDAAMLTGGIIKSAKNLF